MKVQRTPAEEEQIKFVLKGNETFFKTFKCDWTANVLDDLHYRLYGKIPRNFLINISGLIGTPTGIFKSTLGLQIALTLDPLFDLHKRVAFSVNDLLDKVKKHSEFVFTDEEFVKFQNEYKGTYEVYESHAKEYNSSGQLCTKLVLLTKMIFFLDEQTKTLRVGSLIRLQNLIDTCRQRQICFITCGVESYDMNFSTYDLLRIQESHDKYLPEKTVRYGVHDKDKDIYYGYFMWEIFPLTNPMWLKFWKVYSRLKTNFQRVAISQQTSSMDYDNYANDITEEEEYEKCFRITKKGIKKLESNLLRSLILRLFPDLTNQERETILSTIKLRLKDGN